MCRVLFCCFVFCRPVCHVSSPRACSVGMPRFRHLAAFRKPYVSLAVLSWRRVPAMGNFALTWGVSLWRATAWRVICMCHLVGPIFSFFSEAACAPCFVCLVLPFGIDCCSLFPSTGVCVCAVVAVAVAVAAASTGRKSCTATIRRATATASSSRAPTTSGRMPSWSRQEERERGAVICRSTTFAHQDTYIHACTIQRDADHFSVFSFRAG